MISSLSASITPRNLNYLVVSPVRDEECYIEHTLHSMLRQTHKPVRWIIVDDGSSDSTLHIIDKFARQSDFIQVLRNPRRASRQTGVAEILAFNSGMLKAKGLAYDIIVKLDGDLSFEPDYFERLLLEFSRSADLGIASGTYMEQTGAAWQEVALPYYHAAGACKVVRRACFEAIGGFLAERGWDTVDEIRAIARGWRTGHFSKLKMLHWKPEGTAIGLLHTNVMCGEIYFQTNEGSFFFLLKLLRRMLSRPLLIGGLTLG